MEVIDLVSSSDEEVVVPIKKIKVVDMTEKKKKSEEIHNGKEILIKEEDIKRGTNLQVQKKKKNTEIPEPNQQELKGDKVQNKRLYIKRHECAYLNHFITVFNALFENKSNTHISFFNKDQLVLACEFSHLSRGAQTLLLRLTHRKGPWFNVLEPPSNKALENASEDKPPPGCKFEEYLHIYGYDWVQVLKVMS